MESSGSGRLTARRAWLPWAGAAGLVLLVLAAMFAQDRGAAAGRERVREFARAAGPEGRVYCRGAPRADSAELVALLGNLADETLNWTGDGDPFAIQVWSPQGTLDLEFVRSAGKPTEYLVLLPPDRRRLGRIRPDVRGHVPMPGPVPAR